VSEVAALRRAILRSTGIPAVYLAEPVDHGEAMDALCRRDVFERHRRRYERAFRPALVHIALVATAQSHGHPTAWTFPC
jgi:hypothetical protein